MNPLALSLPLRDGKHVPYLLYLASTAPHPHHESPFFHKVDMTYINNKRQLEQEGTPIGLSQSNRFLGQLTSGQISHRRQRDNRFQKPATPPLLPVHAYIYEPKGH